KTTRSDLERATSEAKAGREAAEKLADAEQKLVEMGDVERRVVEAHAMLEKMRNEFELEREGYAVAERDLRSRLTSETERNATLNEQHKSLQKKVDGLNTEVETLRSQNSSLANVYETAKKLSEELAKGAGDLASTLEKTPVDQGDADDPAPAEAELQDPSDDPSEAASSPTASGTRASA
ncbi:MAG: hypothetical protein JO244_07360, partial [Solirubrobacterales bacterium]|nr:hypothetical protein [Solirubrobacterales bacterium]